MDDTPVEYMMRRFGDSGKRPEEFRAILGRFGLSGHHHLQPICKLSGGQKVCAVCVVISFFFPFVRVSSATLLHMHTRKHLHHHLPALYTGTCGICIALS